MSKEERSSPRVLHGVVAQVQFGEASVFEARTLDLSQGGALLDSPVALAIGDSLKLAFQVGRHALNPVSGEVRRVDAAFGGQRFCVAVQFVKPNFQLMELAIRDAKNSEMDSAWTENPTRTFW